MYHPVSYGGELTFHELCNEHVLIGKPIDPEYIKDILLMFWVEQQSGTASPNTAELHSLRLYFDKKDITDQIRKKLIDQLGAANQAEARQQYKRAIGHRLKLLSQAWAGDGKKLHDEKIRADEMTERSWAKLFEHFSTKDSGYLGGLHPLSYVFRDISLPALSLRETLFPVAKPDSNPFSGLSDSRLIICSGNKSSVVDSPDDVTKVFTGRISAHVTVMYHDDWEDALLAETQGVRKALEDCSSRISDITDNLTRVDARFAGLDTTVTKLEGSVHEIEKLIHSRF